MTIFSLIRASLNWRRARWSWKSASCRRNRIVWRKKRISNSSSWSPKSWSREQDRPTSKLPQEPSQQSCLLMSSKLILKNSLCFTSQLYCYPNFEVCHKKPHLSKSHFWCPQFLIYSQFWLKIKSLNLFIPWDFSQTLIESRAIFMKFVII